MIEQTHDQRAELVPQLLAEPFLLLVGVAILMHTLNAMNISQMLPVEVKTTIHFKKTRVRGLAALA
jgi:hypothetical protein